MIRCFAERVASLRQRPSGSRCATRRAYAGLKKKVSKPKLSVSQKLQGWSELGLLKTACELPEVASQSAVAPIRCDGPSRPETGMEHDKRVYLELCGQIRRGGGKKKAGEFGRAEGGNGKVDAVDCSEGGEQTRLPSMISCREDEWLERYSRVDWSEFRREFKEKVDLFELERSQRESFDRCEPLEESQVAFWRQSFPWDADVRELASALVERRDASDVDREEEEEHGRFDGFRLYQREAINATMANHHLLLALPTGSGKTLCYALPACLEPGLTVIVSPLISLMNDQARRLAERGVRSAIISSQLTSHELATLYRAVGEEASDLKLVFVTAERVGKSRRFIQVLKDVHQKGRLRRFVVDEAHCISEWGYDFRQDYRKLSILSRQFPSVPVVAVTGTCTPVVRRDILEQLRLLERQGGQVCHVLQASFNRANLWIQVCRKSRSTPMLDMLRYIVNRGYERASGIVYSMTVAQTERLASFFSSHGVKAVHYHGAMAMNERAVAQRKWETDEANLICTTVAFGLGIDKPNVRYVLHSEIPTSLECYYQQIGRAGRDGELSDCVLFYSPRDRVRIEKITRLGYLTRHRKNTSNRRRHHHPDSDEFVCVERHPAENAVDTSSLLSDASIDDDSIDAHEYDACSRPTVDDDSVDEFVWTMKQEKLDDLTQYCRCTRACRRVQLMRYFGEAFDSSECHGLCDVCAPKKRRVVSKLTPIGCENLKKLIEVKATSPDASGSSSPPPNLSPIIENLQQYVSMSENAADSPSSAADPKFNSMYFVAELCRDDSKTLPHAMVELQRSINKVLKDKVSLRQNAAANKRHRQLQAHREKKLAKLRDRKARLEVRDQEGIVRTTSGHR